MAISRKMIVKIQASLNHKNRVLIYDKEREYCGEFSSEELYKKITSSGRAKIYCMAKFISKADGTCNVQITADVSDQDW